MAQELFVDLRYRGIELGRRLQFDSILASSGYLHAPAPMPVGTVLTIDTGDDLEMTIRVTRVSEQVAGTERPAGMFVEPIELSDRAQARWNDWADGTEDGIEAAPAPAEAAQDAPPSSAPPSSAPPSSASDTKPKAQSKPKKKRNRRKKSK